MNKSFAKNKVNFSLLLSTFLLIFQLISARKGTSTLLQNRKYLQTQDVPTELLLDAARMSTLAYSNPDQISSAFKMAQSGGDMKSSGIAPQNGTVLSKVSTEPFQFNNKVTQASFTVFRYKQTPTSPEQLVIAFQGSDDIQDFINDALILQVPFRPFVPAFKGLLAHTGFVTAFESVIGKADPYVKDAIGKGQKVLVTGHSLGSALAFLAAAHYDNMYPKKISYIGIATPRVGNPAFANYINQKFPVFPRVKFGADPVTKLPSTKVLFLQYQHAGQEYHVGPTDPSPNDVKLENIKDHLTDAYISGIEKSRIVISSPK